jgi:subtilisin family serine protease
MVTAIVTLKEQVDLRSIGGIDRAGRQEAVVRALLAKANASQISLRALLETRRLQGSVSQITAFWIFNGLSVTATADVIRELASLPNVLKITSDDAQLVPLSPPAAPPEQNLSVINAPTLWSLGWQGQGVVIGVMDSGVYGSHPDLTARYRGGSNSWFDPYGQHPTTPFDANGHGTWTTGVLIGGEAGGTAIGVAPQAQWIAAKIFNDAGGSTTTAVHSAFQWMLDPDSNPGTPDAPHAVNNSWGFAAPGCNLEYQLDLQALRAAGILPVFAAGNSGPNPSTSVSPANYPEAFAVGNVNNSDVIANDSSRGPSACGEAQTYYPELVAPGVSIRTTDLLGFYTNASGTSVAAPHVAGALALLLNAFPNLTVDQQAAALSTTAVDLGPAGPDDTYGAGRLDVLAAYNSLIEPVGGIAELPDVAQRSSSAADASAGDSAALAAGLVAMLVALTTGAWYAKRRWGR